MAGMANQAYWPLRGGMAQAWVAHFATPCKMKVRRVQLMSHKSKTPQTAQRPNKHHHHSDEAAHPSSGMDLMNPCCLRGGWPCACLFRCHR